MKSFVITVILFCLLIGAIMINGIYTKNAAKELEDKIEALDFESDLSSELEEIEFCWKKQEKIFGISVGFKEIDKMNELIISLKVAYTHQNKQEFDKFQLLLIDVIDEIIRLEKFSLR